MSKEENSGNAGKKFLDHFNSPKLAEEIKNSDGWGGLGGYMKAKQLKLNEQFQSEYEQKSNIFHGISIWVNGYTSPSSDELKRMMAEHGGQYQHFFSKTHVTHVIASNLPDSKIKALKKNDLVVKPEWLVESIKENRLLSVDKYLLYSVNKRDGTKLKFNLSKLRKTEKRSKNDKSLEEEFDSFSTEFHIGESFNSDSGTNDMSSQEKSGKLNSQITPNIPLAPSLTSHSSTENKNSTAKPAKAGDDNFISEYYAHSRLHHLSMWKAELKKFALSIQQQKGKSMTSSKSMSARNRYVMHVDLDSFFVSVALKLNPELKGKPVAVCHSGRGQKEGKTHQTSWSEIASCSYEARSFGIRNGMFLHAAEQLCPSIICVPYQFEEYRKVSQRFYEILSSYTKLIEAVSCDEALMDISTLVSGDEDVVEFAERLRTEIWNATECKASCGIGDSILIARLATKRAKPDGVCFIARNDNPQFIGEQKITDLPGVGRANVMKIESLGLNKCKELQAWTLSSLQKEFGHKFGETLFNFCRGKDERLLKYEQDRKSVSAEINYGMRFTKESEVEKFIRELSEEIEKRLTEVQKKGSQITLKLMIRRKDSSEPSKFLGHGYCDSFSRSVNLPTPTSDSSVIAKNCLSVLRALKHQPADIRGMGIQVNKLTDASAATASKSLLEFAKTITPEDLYERDKLLHTSINQIPDSGNNKLEQEKNTQNIQNTRIQPITSFLEPITKTQKQEILLPKSKAKQLPALPCIFLDDEEPGPSRATSVTQENVIPWDENVFKELPEHIQQELRQEKNLRNPEDLTSFGLSWDYQPKLSPVKKASHNLSPDKSTNPKVGKSPIRLNKSPGKLSKSLRTTSRGAMNSDNGSSFGRINDNSTRGSPGKDLIKTGKRGRPKKLYEGFNPQQYDSILDTMTRIHVIKDKPDDTTSKTKSPISKNTTANTEFNEFGFISPTRVNPNVLKELPKEIRKEILLAMKKAGHKLKAKPETNPSIPSQNQNKPSVILIDSQEDKELTEKEKMENSKRKQTECSLVTHSTILSPSQLDQSFLRALPEEIQNEIIEDTKSAKRKRLEISESSIKCTSSKYGERQPSEGVDNMNATKSTVTVLNTEDITIEPVDDGFRSNNTDNSTAQEKRTTVTDQFVLSPSKFDQSVMQALPENIRSEILKDLVSKSKTQKKIVQGPKYQSKMDVNEERQEINLNQVLPDFHGTKSCQEVRTLLKSWINEFDGGPLNEDIEELEDYFDRLISSHNLETLFVLLKFMKRFVSNNPCWHAGFNRLHHNVQAEMQKMYCGILPVTVFPVCSND